MNARWSTRTTRQNVSGQPNFNPRPGFQGHSSAYEIETIRLISHHDGVLSFGHKIFKSPRSQPESHLDSEGLTSLLCMPTPIHGGALLPLIKLDSQPGPHQFWCAYALSLIHISEPTRLGMISYA